MKPTEILDRANAEVQVTSIATRLDKDKKPMPFKDDDGKEIEGGAPRWKFTVRSKFNKKQVIVKGTHVGTKKDAIAEAARRTQKALKIKPTKTPEEAMEDRLSKVEAESAATKAENAELREKLAAMSAASNPPDAVGSGENPPASPPPAAAKAQEPTPATATAKSGKPGNKK